MRPAGRKPAAHPAPVKAWQVLPASGSLLRRRFGGRERNQQAFGTKQKGDSAGQRNPQPEFRCSELLPLAKFETKDIFGPRPRGFAETPASLRQIPKQISGRRWFWSAH